MNRHFEDSFQFSPPALEAALAMPLNSIGKNFMCAHVRTDMYTVIPTIAIFRAQLSGGRTLSWRPVVETMGGSLNQPDE